MKARGAGRARLHVRTLGREQQGTQKWRPPHLKAKGTVRGIRLAPFPYPHHALNAAPTLGKWHTLLSLKDTKDFTFPLQGCDRFLPSLLKKKIEDQTIPPSSLPHHTQSGLSYLPSLMITVQKSWIIHHFLSHSTEHRLLYAI